MGWRWRTIGKDGPRRGGGKTAAKERPTAPEAARTLPARLPTPVEVLGGVTVAEASAGIAALTKAMSSRRAAVGCGCDLIVYSEHRCVTSHADFPADQP